MKAIFYSFLVVAAVSAQAATPSHAGSGNLPFVDPTIGNVGALLQPTRPTVQLPNQMIRMAPLRKDYLDDQISAFPLSIVSHRLGEAFSIKPSVLPVTAESWKQLLPYDQDLEVTRPWYYSTYLLDDDVTVEFVPGRKAGIFRFHFPKNAVPSLLFDVRNQGSASWKFLSGTELCGSELYHDRVPVYVYGVFRPGGSTGTAQGGIVTDHQAAEGTGVRAWITFPKDTGAEIEFRYAISYLSPEQARRNYDAELKGKAFADLERQGEQAWARVIDQIQVEGGTEAQRRTFYTALYRCYERMVDITEEGRYFSGYDGKIHETHRPFFVDDWSWDTYLALHPLRTILAPSLEADMLNSYVDMYERSGWMPTFPVLFGDHACMNGFHSSIALLDAYRKGVRDFDVAKAYEGMRKNATEATMLPWRNGPKGPLEDFYYAQGYYPALPVGQPETDPMVDHHERRQAVAVTLGASYDDWAVGQLAGDLGHAEDAAAFGRRALNYHHLWNAQDGMFLPKDEAGHWIEIDPKFDGGPGGRDFYDENNGWTYLWQVQEDLPGLVSLMGGRETFERKLDQLFRESLGRSKHEFWAKFPDATGLVGQFSMGNEPSFHIPYLYNFTGAPWKTQQHIRLLLDVWFQDNIFGIPGDEDGGGMSAFVVFSSMGFYPIVPGLPYYTIGSPIFSKVTIDLPNGKQFRLIARQCSKENKYIQSARLNGKPLDTPFFSHEDLVGGGELILEMGPKPNKSWGLGQPPAPFVVK